MNSARFGGMPRHAQRELLVDAAIDVGQLHREGVDGCAEGHSARAYALPASPPCGSAALRIAGL